MPDPLKDTASHTKAFHCKLGKKKRRRGKGENRRAHGGDGDEDDEDMEDQGAQSRNEDLGSDDEATAHSPKRRKVADTA